MTRAMLTGNRQAAHAVRGDDFYATPYAALAALMLAEGKRLPRELWEPACGNGALVVPLRNRGFTVHATDLNDWGCPGAETGLDFLVADRAPCQAIITNPPFKDIEAFVDRAVALAPYVAFLARLAFMESEGRMTWFPKIGLRRLHIIGERLPMMHRHGYDGPKIGNAAMCFAWFIFERKPRAAHQVPARWVSWKAACRKYPQMPEDEPPDAVQTFPLFGRCP